MGALRDDGPMSKKIDGALKDWVKALRKHARVAGAGAKSLKESQRATARLAAAASAYAEVVNAKSGMENPFCDVVTPGLQEATVASFEAERDHLAEKHKPAHPLVRGKLARGLLFGAPRLRASPLSRPSLPSPVAVQRATTPRRGFVWLLPSALKR